MASFQEDLYAIQDFLGKYANTGGKMKSQITDERLVEIRDVLIKEYADNHGSTRVTATDITKYLENNDNIKLDESTVRGRFISMGVPLGGPNYGKVAAQEPSKPTEPMPTAEDMPSPPPKTNKRTISIAVSSVPDELKQYIPCGNLFNNYIERGIDKRLALHYNLQAAGYECKYPITQGKQGTGKTFGHMYYAYKNSLPFFLFSCFEDFKLSKLFGDKTIENGTIKFQESEFVKAIQNASVILFDEVNAVSQANTYDFHALLQNRRLFIKDSDDGKGKTYNLHPQCRIGFAQNPKSAKYIGGNIRASNFLGRCTFLTYPEFTVKELQKSIKNKYPEMLDDDIMKFSKFYDACIKTIDQAGLPLDVSIRQLTNIIELWLHGLPLEHAIEDGLSSMLEAISQPRAKEAFQRLAEATWSSLMKSQPMRNLLYNYMRRQ
jgi:hypothetical protein